MKITWQDAEKLKSFIDERKARVAELKTMEPTKENRAELRKIETEARDLERKLKIARGNMYPYAS